MLQLLETSCWYFNNCITKLWAQGFYFLYLYIILFQHCFHLEQKKIIWIDSCHVLQTFQTYWFKSSTQYSLVIHSSFYTEYPVLYHPSWTSVLSQFLSLTIIYFILGVKSGSHTFLVPMSANCRPPSHQSILCILHFSPVLTKCILLAICLVCLLSLPFLAMQIADLLSKTIKSS